MPGEYISFVLNSLLTAKSHEGAPCTPECPELTRLDGDQRGSPELDRVVRLEHQSSWLSHLRLILFLPMPVVGGSY